MKKILALVLALAMCATLLAGCGGGSKDSGSSSGSSSSSSSSSSSASADSGSAGGNTLSVYAWDANFNIPALQAAEKAFQKVNPDFKLDIVQQSGSSDVEQAITLAASSGDLSTLPDIVLFQDHYIQKYVADYPNAWQSLEGADIKWDDFGAEKLSYSTIGGVHYGAPVDNGTAVFAYRTDILEQCGYTLADVTKISWDRWLEIARDVKAKTGMAMLSMDHSGDDLPYMMMQAEGLSQWADGKPNFVANESLKKIVEVIVQGAKDGYAANGGSSLYITGNCKNVDLARQFLAYTFGGGEGAIETYDAALRDGGVITTCISAGKSGVYQEGVEFFGGQAIYADIVAMGASVPVIEQSDYHHVARTYIGNAITNIQNGADLVSELQTAQDQVSFEMGL